METKEAVDTANTLVAGITEEAKIKINSMPTFEKAKLILGQVKVIKKAMRDKKEAITKPINAGLKNFRDMFKPIETEIDEIENYLKSEVVKYNHKLVEEEADRQEKALADIESGETMENATKNVERVTQKIDQIKTRKIAKLKIVDATLIPRAFLLPDEKAILGALKDGMEVKGCELIHEEIAINNY